MVDFKNLVFEKEREDKMDLMNIFQEYSKALDEKNDKHERIYKLNRDVTQRSKKVIFSLQRLPGMELESIQKIKKSATQELQNIEQTLLKNIAIELINEEHYKYLGAYCGGLEEYIEAVTFKEFLEKKCLLSQDEIQDKLTYKNGNDLQKDITVTVPPLQYMLGVSDLTGELMRFCIKSESLGDHETCSNICEVLQEIQLKFLSLSYLQNRELGNKLSVLRNSVKKVEDVCYDLGLRKAEMPDKPIQGISSIIVE